MFTEKWVIKATDYDSLTVVFMFSMLYIIPVKMEKTMTPVHSNIRIMCCTANRRGQFVAFPVVVSGHA